MKKVLILATLAAFAISAQAFANDTVTNELPQRPQEFQGKCPNKMHRPPFDREKFEKELNLTDTQKEKLKQMREADKDKMKPIFEKMKSLHEQEKAIFESKLTDDEKKAKLAPINEEKQTLRKEMRTMHEKNKEAFESILTAKQKKTLEKIKEENKKNFEKNMKNRPQKGAFPPPPSRDCNCR